MKVEPPPVATPQPPPRQPPSEAADLHGGRPRLPTLRRFAQLWGFALFCLAVVIIFHAVVLPFVFAVLVAYILAPVVTWISARRAFGRPIPRFAAVLSCYAVVLGLLVFFFTYFLPRLSGDFARLFREAPQAFRSLREDYVPRAGHFVDRYLGAGEEADAVSGPGAGENERPRSQARVTALPGGQWEVDLQGVELEVRPSGSGYIIAPLMPESP